MAQPSLWDVWLMGMLLVILLLLVALCSGCQTMVVTVDDDLDSDDQVELVKDVVPGPIKD